MRGALLFNLYYDPDTEPLSIADTCPFDDFGEPAPGTACYACPIRDACDESSGMNDRPLRPTRDLWKIPGR